MVDPSFRQQLVELLTPTLQAQLSRHSIARVDLIALVTVLWEYRHMRASRQLVSALEIMVPGHPSVAAVAAALLPFGHDGDSEG